MPASTTTDRTAPARRKRDWIGRVERDHPFDPGLAPRPRKLTDPAELRRDARWIGAGAALALIFTIGLAVHDWILPAVQAWLA